MAYKWVTLTSDFDRSIPISKLRYDVGIPNKYSFSNNGYFSEKPSIDTNGKSWSSPTGPSYGYASENRFNLTENFFSNHYYGFTNEYWTAATHTTLVSGTTYEFICPTTLYWSGLQNYTNSAATADLNKFQVYVNIIGFELSEDSLTYTETGGSQTVTVTSSDNDWTASTTYNWISVSPLTGTVGDTVITIVVQPNIFSNRTGTVTFTDGVDTLTLTITQTVQQTLILNNVYRNGNLVPLMARNGEMIYKGVVSKVFAVSTESINADAGGTYTFSISANTNWTTTAPEWVTLSSYSGYGNATITVNVDSGIGEVEGLINVNCWNTTKSINISTSVDYSKKYLTINVLTGGNIQWIKGANGYTLSIDYSKDNGATWTTITPTTAGASISVVAGDKIIFRGNNFRYCAGDASSYRNAFQITGCTVNVSGNIMSLCYGDNFSGQTTLQSAYTFTNLFFNSTGIVSIENLVLPATTLTNNCYFQMFYGCTSLTTAPELPATTLANNCYQYMFRNCSSLNYIKCLATNISASNCTYYWVNGVSATGTFVKNPSMNDWSRGISGIPSGWTVQDAE